MTGADILVQGLRAHGIEFLSIVCGNGLSPLLDACRRADFPVIDTRTEYGAAYLADAYARLTGKVAVVAVSSGIAHSNAFTGLMNAWFDGTPILLLTGESARDGADTGAFQEFDHSGLAAPLCKYSARIEHPAQIDNCLNEALARAVAGRPGPVQLSIPASVTGAAVAGSAPPTRLVPARMPAGGAPDPALIDAATNLLAGSQRPLIVAGSGVFYAGAGESLVDLVHQLPAPLTVPIWERGCIDEAEDNFVGVIGAATGGPELLAQADLVLIAGAQVDYRLGRALPPAVDPAATLIRTDADPAQLQQGVTPDLAISADPGAVLAALADQLRGSDSVARAAWLDLAKETNDTFRARFAAPLAEDEPMTGHHLVEALRPYAEDPDCTFLIDGGNIGQWAHQVLADRYPARWLTCGASGVIGWGIPGALGARLARPEGPVILLTGDGSVHFGIPEIEPAVRHNLPFVAVIADDRAWGIVLTEQKKAFGGEGVTASLIGPVAYAGVAAAYGARGAIAHDIAGLRYALDAGIESACPTIIHAPIQTGGPTELTCG
ncbi:MAG: thiamine pyrophosphate-binding protein [Chloroflexota bacterium]|nr:thiamine pyrophosphate-binding protein [Chloroflexota bacterium]